MIFTVERGADLFNLAGNVSRVKEIAGWTLRNVDVFVYGFGASYVRYSKIC